MRKLVCPQCKIANVYLKDQKGNRLPVYITSEGKIIPKNLEDSVEGFDTDTVYCLGCSWSGSTKKMIRY